MQDHSPPFALALRESRRRPLEFGRAVTRLTGKEYSPVMASRWINGTHDAPAPAVALAMLLGRLPEDQRQELTAGAARKPYTKRLPPSED